MLESWESLDKSIKKSVLKPGVFSKKPNERSTCHVTVKDISVTGASVDDLKREHRTEILDSEGERVLVLGSTSDSQIDWKVERVLQMMNLHERSLVTLALPAEQRGDVSNPTVRFEITLDKCVRHKPIWEWSAREKHEVALAYKEKGVDLFRESRIVDAFHKFSRACKILITLEPMPDPDLPMEKQLESDIKSLRLALYNNMAMCQLSRKNYEHVVSLCGKVLDRDRGNVKALYRRGIAYGRMKDNEKAVADLKVALALEPGNCAVKEQFEACNSKLQESIERSNDMVRRMFKP